MTTGYYCAVSPWVTSSGSLYKISWFGRDDNIIHHSDRLAFTLCNSTRNSSVTTTALCVTAEWGPCTSSGTSSFLIPFTSSHYCFLVQKEANVNIRTNSWTELFWKLRTGSIMHCAFTNTIVPCGQVLQTALPCSLTSGKGGPNKFGRIVLTAFVCSPHRYAQKLK